MKIDLSPKGFKLVRIVIALIALSLAGDVVYAASTLSIQNSGNVVVATGTNLLASLGQSSTTTCSSTTGPYSDSGLAITTWSVPVGEFHANCKHHCLCCAIQRGHYHCSLTQPPDEPVRFG